MPSPTVVTVPARAGLVGNPSDLYGGAVVAVPLPSLCARVEVVDAGATRVVGDEEGRALVEAAMARGPVASGCIELRWTTAIPRAVGLAGSSAIVVATLRALLARGGTTMADLDLALLAQAVEAEDLGIVAGLQDRAVQAFGGPVLVDVRGAAPVVTRLTPARPLRIAVAWIPAAAGDSGTYHRDLQQRADADRVGAMAELGALAEEAALAFSAGDAGALVALMAASARIRAQVAPLSPAHDRLVAAVTAAGLEPNSAGSGGAVAAVVVDDDSLGRATRAVRAAGGDIVVETFA